MAVKVRQHKGKWWVFIDHKGKRKAKCVGDKRAAEQVASGLASEGNGKSSAQRADL